MFDLNRRRSRGPRHSNWLNLEAAPAGLLLGLLLVALLFQRLLCNLLLQLLRLVRALHGSLLSAKSGGIGFNCDGRTPARRYGSTGTELRKATKGGPWVQVQSVN